MLNGPFTTLRLPGPFARRRGRGAAFAPDAAAYIAAVEAADEQTLEEGVKQAIDGFVTGCKADGIWDAIKASCILAGARTLNGALVPLAGDSPTNFNFVSADYDRVTGLKGDGSTKYLDSNRSNDADPQNSKHVSVWVSSFIASTNMLIAIGAFDTSGASNLYISSSDTGRAFLNVTGAGSISFIPATGFVGASRANAETYSDRSGGVSQLWDRISQSPLSGNLFVLARNDGGLQFPSPARISLYSIGEAVDLATLDARVSTLMAEIEAALT